MKFRIVFLLIFIFCLEFINAQEFIKMPTCEDGIEEAILNSKKGFFISKSYGLTLNIEFDGFAEFYNNFIKEKYKISFEDGGCVISKYSDCYKKKTQELIFQKYGSDIYERAKFEAAEEFKKTEEFLNEVKPKIDSNYVFHHIPFGKKPEFIIDGQESDFIKYLGFDDFEVDYFNLKAYCEISFIVEKDGSLSNIELQNAETSKEIVNEVLLEKLINLPRWKSGSYLGEPIRCSVYYKVPLDLL